MQTHPQTSTFKHMDHVCSRTCIRICMHGKHTCHQWGLSPCNYYTRRNFMIIHVLTKYTQISTKNAIFYYSMYNDGQNHTKSELLYFNFLDKICRHDTSSLPKRADKPFFIDMASQQQNVALHECKFIAIFCHIGIHSQYIPRGQWRWEIFVRQLGYGVWDLKICPY